MSNLDEKMQARLDAFRKSVVSGKPAIARDYGDDFEDYRRKELEEWNAEVRNNTMHGR